MKQKQHTKTGKKTASSEIDVINPATLEVIDQVSVSTKASIKKCIGVAEASFQEWKKTTADEKYHFLMSWHDLISKHEEGLASNITAEQGKPFKEALGEIRYANGFIRWYAEEAKRIYGQLVPSSAQDKRLMVMKQGVGVVGAITPWNFPAAMITRKVAPALAAGCSVIVKPAEETPLTAINLVALAYKAGCPKGLLQVVAGDPAMIGRSFMEDQRIKKITFTGSTEVGKLLMAQASKHVKKITLELGGHAPFIVAEDADVEKSVEALMQSKFRNAGQTCISCNRVYVHRKVYKEFKKLLLKEVKSLRVGPGNEDVDIGPLINRATYSKVLKHINDAKRKGGKVICGGGSLNFGKGYYIAPTILDQVSSNMLCMKEETFGPVIPLSTFQNDDDVIEVANDTPYGLAAYVCTRDVSRAFYFSEALDYGIIGLNDGMPSTPQAPFGGFKESGLGREGGAEGIEEYLESKFISMKL